MRGAAAIRTTALEIHPLLKLEKSSRVCNQVKLVSLINKETWQCWNIQVPIGASTLINCVTEFNSVVGLQAGHPLTYTHPVQNTCLQLIVRQCHAVLDVCQPLQLSTFVVLYS